MTGVRERLWEIKKIRGKYESNYFGYEWWLISWLESTLAEVERQDRLIEVLESRLRLDREAFADMADGCSSRENILERSIYGRARTELGGIEAVLFPPPSAEPDKEEEEK